jgi:hypothetical protein
MPNSQFIVIPVQAIEKYFAPLYGETKEHLLRMGIIDAKEKVKHKHIRTICMPFAATLYEALLEAGENITDTYIGFAEMVSNEDKTGLYLYLCVLYAKISKSIPEPIQWISGNRDALLVFCDELAELMRGYMIEDGILDEEGAEE